MNRRQFVKQGLLLGAASWTAQAVNAQQPTEGKRTLVIDCHCHAGRGMNYGKDPSTSPPWTTYNDPHWVLRQAEEGGIDRSVIFPISNVTYEKANEEIAEYVRRWPDKFIGFAKHDGKTEAGKIRALLEREVRQLGLKGLKLHGTPTEEMVQAAAELRIPILFHPARVSDCLEVVRVGQLAGALAGDRSSQAIAQLVPGHLRRSVFPLSGTGCPRTAGGETLVRLRRSAGRRPRGTVQDSASQIAARKRSIDSRRKHPSIAGDG